MPLVFDLGPLHNREAHTREDFFHTVANDRQRVAMAEERHAAGQRDIEGVLRRGVGSGRRRVLGPSGLDGVLQIVGIAADVFFLIGSRGGEQLHPRGDHAVLSAEKAIA